MSPKPSRATIAVLGTRADITYRVDVVEHARRRRVGLGAITDMDMLDALMNLPTELPVAITNLTERERHTLRRIPTGAVDETADTVLRRVVAPLAVDFALIPARHWKTGLRAAGSFAPFCARAMHLVVEPADLDEAAVRAAFYGVGIYTGHRDRPRELVAPEPHVRQRHSCGQWWFAEEIHRLTRESAGG